MLKLNEIVKDYDVANTKVHALKGINITFRDSEFVSVLGPSGCGKTTLLNIIGGLDHYTSGDLIIDGTSTKDYSDRDWDTYRNHRIGFIFQSYNLIPHQTILENVELALNIAGVEKEERIKRAKEALDKVGLDGQYNKKPNQLSGGQCQRVAIARALVSNPEILLADEPTGALDTVTSGQIMELIKEISKDRLVIMVTHNPELAEQYSTRIVKLLDGNLVSDSMPYDAETNKKQEKTKKKKIGSKKSKLSLLSAFKLSARNLRSKFKRTLLVCIAGSIGITGVASVLSVSTGIKQYINNMQDDMLSGNPITISESTIDIEALTSFSDASATLGDVKESIEDGKINVNFLIDLLIKRSKDITSLQIKNDITEEYVDYVLNMPSSYYGAIMTSYGIDVTNNIYTDYNFADKTYKDKQVSLSSAKQMYISLLEATEYKNLSSVIYTLSDTFNQLPNSEDYIMSQYEYVTPKDKSSFPKNKDEIMIVINDESELSDLLLAQLGYYSQEEFLNIINKSADENSYKPELDKTQFTYEELLGKKFTYYTNNDVFNKVDENNPLYSISKFTYNNVASESWEGLDLKITAIVKPKKGLSYGSLQSGFYYTSEFVNHVISEGIKSDIVKYLETTETQSFNSVVVNGIETGITYMYSYKLGEGEQTHKKGLVGQVSQSTILMSMMGSSGSFGSSGGANAGGSESTSMPVVHTLSMRNLGGVDSPNKIVIYPVDFENKDFVVSYLSEWNSKNDIIIGDKTIKAEDRQDIMYTDTLSLVINLLNMLIDIVTIALVCFTSLSLVVSSVMIAIITYVSVIERIKEIGVIRSLGGRKKDVSHLFNAETFIIGGCAGLIGVGFTYLLSLLINTIVKGLGGISSIAILTPLTSLIMIAISIFLTFISGTIPARLAAKKDPVVALRSE